MITILFFLVGFNMWLILFNPCFASMISPCDSALFRRFPLFWSNSSAILRFSKLMFSRSTSDPDYWVAVYLARFSCFRTSCTALATRVFRSWYLARQFLAPWNHIWPAPPPLEVDQVNFMSLDWACITIHKFVSCPIPYRGHTGRFLFLLLVLKLEFY